MFDVPILMLVFNRVDTTQQVFNLLREIKPKYLYVVADGARHHKTDEAEKCEAVREIFTTQIDWDCELHTLFRPQNLGCKLSVSTGIDWFFDNVEAGIILEDDCLVSADFFPFCQTMLERYKTDETVMQVSALQMLSCGFRSESTSYVFNRIPYIWGWATWRRAWQKYNRNMEGLESYLQQNEQNLVKLGGFISKKIIQKFKAVAANQIDTWDYQWTYTVLSNNGLCVLPTRNLVLNIGFNTDATHTSGVSPVANMTIESLLLPLSHPLNKQLIDWQLEGKIFSVPYGTTFLARLFKFIRNKMGI